MSGYDPFTGVFELIAPMRSLHWSLDVLDALGLKWRKPPGSKRPE